LYCKAQGFHVKGLANAPSKYLAPKLFKIVTINENNTSTISVQKKKNRRPVYGLKLHQR